MSSLAADSNNNNNENKNKNGKRMTMTSKDVLNTNNNTSLYLAGLRFSAQGYRSVSNTRSIYCEKVLLNVCCLESLYLVYGYLMFAHLPFGIQVDTFHKYKDFRRNAVSERNLEERVGLKQYLTEFIRTQNIKILFNL